MIFHEYVTLRSQWAKQEHTEDFHKIARANSSDAFRRHVLAVYPRVLEDESDAHLQAQLRQQIFIASTEQMWVDANRPYYNFWPVAVDIAKTVKLDLPLSTLRVPYDHLLLRFAHGNEVYGIGTAMIARHNTCFIVMAWFAGSSDAVQLIVESGDPSKTVDQWLSDETSEGGFKIQEWNYASRAFDHAAATTLLLRLVVFVSLLARDEDLITPIVLSKDRRKYEQSTDDEAKRWIEERAARRLGKGFDVGKKLQHASSSPHWRNPHMCLFWVGEGRQTPILKMRSGSVIAAKSKLADVPTGFLGPETSVEDEVALQMATPRAAISKATRFAILKRDGYRCRLCGRTEEDSVKLHVDHKVALANGGSNEDTNLWTLCEDCNLGKSDKAL